MKFVLAAGILAQTLPQLDALESKGLEELNGYQRLRRISAVNSILRQDVSYNRLENFVLRHDWFTQRRKKNVLKNVDSSFDECEPTGDDADIGILGCSLGEHCVESDASSLGGVCVIDEAGSRRLQNILPPDVCDPNAELPYTCNCTLFDVASSTGQFSCNISDDYCFLPGYCGSLKIDRTIAAGVDSSKYCITFSTPSVAEICYSVDTTPSCSIAVNGVTCNSCEVVDIMNDGIRGCYDWECGNIFPNSTGNDCQGKFVITELFPNALPNSTNTFECDICGDGGMITTPNVSLPIPNLDPPLTCGQIDAAAKNGSILDAQCPLLQPFVQQSCGCVPRVFTPPSTSPSMIPSIPAATSPPTLPPVATNVTSPPTLPPVATETPVANVTSPPTSAPLTTMPPTAPPTVPPLTTVPPTVPPTAPPLTTVPPTVPPTLPPVTTLPPTVPPTLPPVTTLPPTVPSTAPVAPTPTSPPTDVPLTTRPPSMTLPPVSTAPPIYMSMSMSMSMSMGMRVRDLRDMGGARDLLDMPEMEEVLESEFGRFL